MILLGFFHEELYEGAKNVNDIECDCLIHTRAVINAVSAIMRKAIFFKYQRKSVSVSEISHNNDDHISLQN
jgi:hypothetical protein